MLPKGNLRGFIQSVTVLLIFDGPRPNCGSLTVLRFGEHHAGAPESLQASAGKKTSAEDCG